LGKDSVSDYYNQEFHFHLRPHNFFIYSDYSNRINFAFDPEILLLGLDNLTQKTFNFNTKQSIQFRKGEIYYNIGNFIMAKALFKNYLTNLTPDSVNATNFKDEAEEYLRKITQTTKQVGRAR